MILVAWLIALRTGPAAIPVATLVYVGLVTAAFGAWAIPSLTVVSRTNSIASALPSGFDKSISVLNTCVLRSFVTVMNQTINKLIGLLTCP